MPAPCNTEKEKLKIITEIVADHYQLPISSIFSKGRINNAVYARGVCCYIACSLDIHTQPVSDYYGRERSNVSHHKSMVNQVISVDLEFRKTVFSLINKVHAQLIR